MPPLCLSSKLRPIHIFSLGLIAAFYPFLLILLTWLHVELHGHNFRPIVCLWRPFHGYFVWLRTCWNTKTDLIDVFTSFFLLSYSKILYQIMLTFDTEEITSYSLIDNKNTRVVMYSVLILVLVPSQSRAHADIFLFLFFFWHALQPFCSFCLSSFLYFYSFFIQQKYFKNY